MRACLVALTLLATAAPAAGARKIQFPYEATIEADDTYVRSGPGSKYYPTGKLKRGQRVTVQRHDPGGWHMIAPPAGSFSWVKARYIDKIGPDRGTANSNNVVVRVGSFESDIREMFQRKLAQGDEVQILGEKELPPETGTGAHELWYRIAPPRGEWRWVAGRALSPPPGDVSADADENPFEMPAAPANNGRNLPAARAPDRDAGDDDFFKPLPMESDRDYLADDSAPPRSLKNADATDGIVNRPIVRRQGPVTAKKVTGRAAEKQLAARLEALDRLDARFRSILDKNPLEWDFTQLERDYRQLRIEVDSADVEQMIDARLARIDEHRKTKSEHEEFARQSDETMKRDAELAEVQRRHEARLASLRQPRFDGAGILNRSALRRKGAPRYVLLAPGGKVLAYLVSAPGLNLEPWVGRPVGVTGSRVPHPELKADLITVIRLTPVRLSQ
jgi:hypothetical protein